MFRILFILFGHVQRLQYFIQTTRVTGQPEKLPADQGDSFLVYCTTETRVGQLLELQTKGALWQPNVLCFDWLLPDDITLPN
jgi:hypothetical protein